MLTENKGRANLKDVAKLAKVSPAAAGNVLLGTGKGSVRVSEETAARIRKIASDLGYSPNVIARQLRGMPSRCIGVIIDSYAPEPTYRVLSEMERGAALRGYRFMVGQSHENIDRVTTYISDFTARGIDGIISLSHDYPEGGEKIAAALSQFKNVVFIEKPLIEEDRLCYVAVDFADGIRQSVEYLVAKSHRRIGMIINDARYPSNIQRREGYIAAGRQYGLPADPDLIRVIGEGYLQVDNKIQDVVADLIRRVGVDAILAENDIMAVRVINALTEMGLKVPAAVSVIGYDDIDLASLYRPAVTTVNQLSEHRAKIAIDLLIDLIEEKEIPPENRRVILKPKLVVRDSA